MFVAAQQVGKRLLGNTQVPLKAYFRRRGFGNFWRLFVGVFDRQLKKYLIARRVCGAKDGLVIRKLPEALLVGNGGRNGKFTSLGKQNGKVF